MSVVGLAVLAVCEVIGELQADARRPGFQGALNLREMASAIK